MTRIINGVAYATDYEEIVGVEAGSGQHPVVTKVVRPGDVNFSADRDRPQGRRRADADDATAPAESKASAADSLPGADAGH